MFSQNQEDVKLEWMYKGAHSTVDREEYLLGRSVDKTLEQLNEEEKQQQSGVRQPKNHVEHECIPPSIRDYKEQVGEQVDLAAKLQEDPLVAIKKREEENRRQFLNNPIQIKKLQKALKAQKKLKKKKKKKKHKGSDSDSNEELDRKLAKKLKLLKDDLSKSKNDDNLDTILMHKYNQLKSKLSENDIKDILQGTQSGSSSSNSDNEVEQRISKRKKRNSSESSSESKRVRKCNVANNDKEKEKHRKRNNEHAHKSRKDRSSRSSSSERRKDQKKSHNLSSTKRSISNGENDRQAKLKKHTESRINEVGYKKKDSEYKETKSKWKGRGRSSSFDSEPDLKRTYGKSRQDDCKRDNLSSSSAEDSDVATSSRKHWGLVKADGSKLPVSSKRKGETKLPEQHNRIPETKTTIIHKRKALSKEEKEKKLREMMENASWRDKERSKNVKYYREKELEEAESRKNYDHEFLHKQLVKSAGSGSVESRIKSNINNIQRSGTDMNRHFSKRH